MLIRSAAPLVVSCRCGHLEKHHGPRGCRGCAHPQHCLDYQPVELTEAQRACLAALEPTREKPMRDVVELTGYSNAWTSETLYKLRAMGLANVRRARDKVERNITWAMWRRIA